MKIKCDKCGGRGYKCLLDSPDPNVNNGLTCVAGIEQCSDGCGDYVPCTCDKGYIHVRFTVEEEWYNTSSDTGDVSLMETRLVTRELGVEEILDTEVETGIGRWHIQLFVERKTIDADIYKIAREGRLYYQGKKVSVGEVGNEKVDGAAGDRAGAGRAMSHRDSRAKG